MKLDRTRHLLAISISIGCFGYFLSAYGDERQNIVWIDQAGAEAFFDLGRKLAEQGKLDHADYPIPEGP
jgi:hypothetical protein